MPPATAENRCSNWDSKSISAVSEEDLSVDIPQVKMGDESAPARAKWYVIAFHYQIGFLFFAISLAPIFLIFVPRPPNAILPPQWTFIVLAIVMAATFGYMTIRVVRYVRWLRGVGPPAKQIIGPPLRANCVTMGIGGVLFTAFGVSLYLGGDTIPGIGFILAGLYALSVSICGFLWKTETVRTTAALETPIAD